MVLGGRIILEANAEYLQHEWGVEGIESQEVTGGVTSTLGSLMGKDDLWIGWGRGEADFHPDVVDEDNKVKDTEGGCELKRIELSDGEVRNFYRGYSNRILWPIFHGLGDRVEGGVKNLASKKDEYWSDYREVNQKYGDAILEELDPEEDCVMVQDYHLIPVPSMIKEEEPDAKISFFNHIPWPEVNSFKKIPYEQRKELMSVLASDFIGFHTDRWVDNFLECAEEMGANIDEEKGIVERKGEKTVVESIPLGIDYDFFNKYSDKTEVERLEGGFPVKYRAVGIDRLDPSKGVPQRFGGFHPFFREYNEYLGEFGLVQRVAPSRTEVQEYQEELERIKRKENKINEKYGHAYPEGGPLKVHYTKLPSVKDIIPYYQMADIGVVTSLKDGMNLVSKEFVASHSERDPGVLILSEEAGAATQLVDEEKGAIPVDPSNEKEIAEAYKQALEMDIDETKGRYEFMDEIVQKYDSEYWRNEFMERWEESYELL